MLVSLSCWIEERDLLFVLLNRGIFIEFLPFQRLSEAFYDKVAQRHFAVALHKDIRDIDILLRIFELPGVPSNHSPVVHTEVEWAGHHIEVILLRNDLNHLFERLIAGDSTHDMHFVHRDFFQFD